MAATTPEDPEREERITMEIVVDAYDSDERVAGWHGYLENEITFPFTATLRRKDPKSSKPPRKVTVLGMADFDDCLGGRRVEIDGDDEPMDVPLARIDVLKADKKTRQAAADWHYWVKRGYSF